MARRPTVYTSRRREEGKKSSGPARARWEAAPGAGPLVAMACSRSNVQLAAGSGRWMQRAGTWVAGSGPGPLVVKQRLTRLGHLHFRWALAPPPGENSLVKIMLSFWLLAASVCMCVCAKSWINLASAAAARGRVLKTRVKKQVVGLCRSLFYFHSAL